MEIPVPDFALLLLLGGTAPARAAFLAAQFRPSEILSRAPRSSGAAGSSDIESLYRGLAPRLAERQLTVIDATGLSRDGRQRLASLARRYHAPRRAIVLDTTRSATTAHSGLPREGFPTLHLLRSEEEIAAARVLRLPLACDRRGGHGPFDIIGDVHGCRVELERLLTKLGYRPRERCWAHPEGRRAIFLGDVVDRGPDTPGVLRHVIDMAAGGSALAVPGNHDLKLVRKLLGREVEVNGGLAVSLAQLDRLMPQQRAALYADLVAFFTALPSHLWLDDGRLVVAHAGLDEGLHGRDSARVWSFALHGETTGESDRFGMRKRTDWAAGYRGQATVVYGHIAVPLARWVNNTICIDTGCVFGGRLSALRYPEREIVAVRAARAYFAAGRPIDAEA